MPCETAGDAIKNDAVEVQAPIQETPTGYKVEDWESISPPALLEPHVIEADEDMEEVTIEEAEPQPDTTIKNDPEPELEPEARVCLAAYLRVKNLQGSLSNGA